MPDLLPALSPWLASNLFECLVVLASILGAYWSSSGNRKTRASGFGIWLFSNAALGWEFWINGNVPYTLLFIIYEMMNIRGVYNNLKVNTK